MIVGDKPVMQASQVEFIWVDFETNGLHKDGPVVPFEVGLKATDLAGQVYAETQKIILPYNWQVWVDEMSEYVTNMHTDSALLHDMWQLDHAIEAGAAMQADPVTVDLAIHNWLTVDLGLSTGTYPMAGSTVHFDRRVMEEHMPQTHSWFHYRDIDISTVKELCRKLNPRVYENRPRVEQRAHRPLADLDASIREYLFYRENFFFEA
jgi:oligoribonuclease